MPLPAFAGLAGEIPGSIGSNAPAMTLRIESAKAEAFCSVFVTATRCRARTILNVLTRFRKRLSDRGIGVAMLPTRCTMWRQKARKGIQRGHFRRRLRFQIHIGFSTRDQDAPRTRIDC